MMATSQVRLSRGSWPRRRQHAHALHVQDLRQRGIPVLAAYRSARDWSRQGCHQASQHERQEVEHECGIPADVKRERFVDEQSSASAPQARPQCGAARAAGMPGRRQRDKRSAALGAARRIA